MHHPSHSPGAGRPLDPVHCPALAAQPGIRHGFFTRNGGASSGFYDSLNCAYGTGDDTAHVAENLRRITETLGTAPHNLCKPHQIHSAIVATATEGWPRESAPEADAVVTNIPGLALGITTADCLPILFADTENRVIACAHAGWKGALGGVIEATVAAMTGLGAKLPAIHATIGPAIAQGSYEVDDAFRARFLAQDHDNQLFFVHGARAGHWQFDLKAYAKERLKDAGITHINVLAHDTYLQENDFFSYRRTTHRKEPVYGCQLSAIILEE